MHSSALEENFWKMEGKNPLSHKGMEEQDRICMVPKRDVWQGHMGLFRELVPQLEGIKNKASESMGTQRIIGKSLW